MILVCDQCKTNYLLIRALCYPTRQNRNNVLEESDSMWNPHVIDLTLNEVGYKQKFLHEKSVIIFRKREFVRMETRLHHLSWDGISLSHGHIFNP